jgi:hypothetical protein
MSPEDVVSVMGAWTTQPAVPEVSLIGTEVTMGLEEAIGC